MGGCRVLRELLGSAVAGRQGEPLQRKHLLSKALKRAHNSLGNHQLVSQARRDHPACVRPVCQPTITCHCRTCMGSLQHCTGSQECSADHMMMPGTLF